MRKCSIALVCTSDVEYEHADGLITEDRLITIERHFHLVNSIFEGSRKEASLLAAVGGIGKKIGKIMERETSAGRVCSALLMMECANAIKENVFKIRYTDIPDEIINSYGDMIKDDCLNIVVAASAAERDNLASSLNESKVERFSEEEADKKMSEFARSQGKASGKLEEAFRKAGFISDASAAANDAKYGGRPEVPGVGGHRRSARMSSGETSFDTQDTLTLLKEINSKIGTSKKSISAKLSYVLGIGIGASFASAVYAGSVFGLIGAAGLIYVMHRLQTLNVESTRM